MHASIAGGFTDRSLGEKLFRKLPSNLGQKNQRQLEWQPNWPSYE